MTARMIVATIFFISIKINLLRGRDSNPRPDAYGTPMLPTAFTPQYCPRTVGLDKTANLYKTIKHLDYGPSADACIPAVYISTFVGYLATMAVSAMLWAFCAIAFHMAMDSFSSCSTTSP